MDFYIQAATILTKLDNKAGSIKGLTLQSGAKQGARTYALILETLKCQSTSTTSGMSMTDEGQIEMSCTE